MKLRTDPPNWYIRPDYRARDVVASFDAEGRPGHVQPDVYPFAAHLARRLGVRHIIDLGCGSGQNLVALQPEFEVIGVDFGPNIEHCHRPYGIGTWLEHDLELSDTLPLSDDVVADSVIVCCDAIEHLVNPRALLRLISSLAEVAAAVLVSSPERDLARGWGDLGPPANPCHVREWTLCEFRRLLDWAGLQVDFLGLTATQSVTWAKETMLAVCAGWGSAAGNRAPRDFRVLAVMPALNEEDIIAPSITALVDAGVEVHVIDHWSTDRTLDRVRTLAGRGRITWEQFPPGGPYATYRWSALLDRVDEVAARSGADWCLYHPADERRLSPWPEVQLPDALFHVQRHGFNAVDHTVLNFLPVDYGYRDGDDFEHHFRYFRFGQVPGPCPQVTAWRNPGQSVRLADSAGHQALFPGRRVFPYNFLLKHYPVRSQSQGERKWRDRIGRWDPVERARGWPVRGDHRTEDHVFRHDPSELIEIDGTFAVTYLTERLGNTGTRRRAQP